jgi:hypothetical protein
MARELFASKLISIWMGAFFFWMLKGFKGSYQNMISEKYETRNSWVGYFFQLLCAAGLVYFVVFE